MRENQMIKSNKVLIVFITLGIILFFGVIFYSFIFENIFKPLSLVIWIFLRIFVLSIDQKIIWYVIIALIIFVIIFKLSKQSYQEKYEKDFSIKNTYIKNLELWYFSFSINSSNYYDRKSLKSELAQMLLTIYASNKRISVNYELFKAFKRRNIEIPDNIFYFLFNDEVKRKRNIFIYLYNRLSGREIKDYYIKLEECLIFLENFSNESQFPIKKLTH